MVTKSTTKAADTVEQTPLQVVDAGIKQIVADHDINIQKNRYKAMRAIAWQAFMEAIEAGDFDALVERASANVGDLPAGWELTAEHKPAPKAPVKEPAAKPAPAKRAASSKTRRRPTRKAVATTEAVSA